MRYLIYDPDLEVEEELGFGNVTLGREVLEKMLAETEKRDLTIIDPTYVSKRHCSIDLSLQPVIFDKNSKNGTQVNGKRVYVDSPVLLNNGDIISMGPWKVEFIARE